MEQIKTIGDINRFIDRLQFNMWEIPPNLELKIMLGTDDYVNIHKDMSKISGHWFPININNGFITYQYMGIKTTIVPSLNENKEG